MEILKPLTHEILRTTELGLQFKLHGSEEVQPGFHHFHWGFGIKGSGEAQLAKPSTQEEINDINLDFLEDGIFPDGNYELCVYAAREDHTHLSDQTCVELLLQRNGIVILSPVDGVTYDSLDVPLQYYVYGKNPPSALEIRQDGSDDKIVEPLTSDGGTIALSNGIHTLDLKALSSKNVAFEELITITLSVDSKLSIDSAVTTRKLLRKTLKKGGLAGAKKARKLLRSMLKGGTQDPAIKKLNKKYIKKTLAFVRKGISSAAKNKKKSDEHFRAAIKRLNQTVKN